jgi:hypothetical protein
MQNKYRERNSLTALKGAKVSKSAHERIDGMQKGARLKFEGVHL